MEYRLNTGNSDKLKEFRSIFEKRGHTLVASTRTLREIDSDPVTVVVHKASQLPENVLAEDTSLSVENEEVGIHVKWLLDRLNQYIGKKAVWVVLLAYHAGEKVYVFKGEVAGEIVAPRGSFGFGFDAVFQPEGSVKTLAEGKEDCFNARVKAVDQLLARQPYQIEPLLTTWNGRWQHDS